MPISRGSIFFCQIAEAYFSGLTNGTDATHYSPSTNVTREQMAAFITRTLDQTLKRESERAALDQYVLVLPFAGRAEFVCLDWTANNVNTAIDNIRDPM